MAEEEEITLTEQITSLIQQKKKKELRELCEETPYYDVAEVLDEFEDVTMILFVFRVIDNDYASDVFSELSSDTQERIVNAFTDKELIGLLENSYADDIVDALDDFPANLVSRILKVAPADLRKDINYLLNFKENTAGSVMTTEYIEMRDTLTVQEAIKSLRANGRDAVTIYTIFVKDKKRTLVGTVDLDDLLFAKEDEMLNDIMNVDFVTCNVNDDQEQVANDFKRYDLNAMAVVNSENKLVGVITIDDVVDIIVEEASEDVAKLNQVTPIDEPYLKTPIWKLVLKCAPWIIALMVLQIFSTLIFSRFESAIASFAILSFFTPLIMDAGGNSGGQTTTIMVRAIALDEFGKGDTKKVIWKEFRVALCIAGIIAVFAFCWIMFEMAIGIVDMTETMTHVGEGLEKWQVMMIVSSLVGSTLFVTMLISRLVGSLLPFLAKKLKRDPAVMCSPLTTTVVDICSLLTYFLLWTYVFSPLLHLH